MHNTLLANDKCDCNMKNTIAIQHYEIMNNINWWLQYASAVANKFECNTQ